MNLAENGSPPLLVVSIDKHGTGEQTAGKQQQSNMVYLQTDLHGKTNNKCRYRLQVPNYRLSHVHLWAVSKFFDLLTELII